MNLLRSVDTGMERAIGVSGSEAGVAAVLEMVGVTVDIEIDVAGAWTGDGDGCIVGAGANALGPSNVVVVASSGLCAERDGSVSAKTL